MTDALYSLDDFQTDLDGIEALNEADEIEIPVVPLRPQTPHGWNDVDMQAEINRTAKKLAKRLCMALNFFCVRQKWDMVTPDEYNDFVDTITEILDYHPVLARGGRILSYLDGAMAIPEFYASRMMFEGRSEPSEGGDGEAQTIIKPEPNTSNSVVSKASEAAQRPNKGGFS